MGERTEQQNVRLSSDEFQAIDRMARRAGRSRSEWIRDVLMAAAGRCPVCGGKWGKK